MSTYTEIKPAGRLESESTRTTSPTKSAVPWSLKIECPLEDDDSTIYYNPSSIKGIKSPTTLSTKQFPAHIMRARRRCLTQIPCNMVRDAILPSHISKMLSPLPSRQHDSEYGLYATEPVTPTKEKVLELLCTSPNFSNFNLSSQASNPALSKPFKLHTPALLPLHIEPSVVSNQLAELLSSSESGCTAVRKPAKRRVRATYGVRLESIRVNVETECTRKCRSQDEYQPSNREGLRLAPIAHPAKL